MKFGKSLHQRGQAVDYTVEALSLDESPDGYQYPTVNGKP